MRQKMQENETAIREICAGFDEAHRAWTANKKREKYGRRINVCFSWIFS